MRDEEPKAFFTKTLFDCNKPETSVSYTFIKRQHMAFMEEIEG
ncbi:MAG: hypothetical protein A4E57_00645 [Syntrophorhabdaceae bacterium PtaU1.Bin034]|jgi:hypothetical protein|nr:MAG: hypothetical protein A4E57_00645 [Syntrophorhabdaceae bacterium PtaU1.Bin034]